MKKQFDLSQLDWRLSGWSPNLWRTQPGREISDSPWASVRMVSVRIPGSVQQALLDAGMLPNWNRGLNTRACEWVENRHWVYEAAVPDEWLVDGSSFTLRCLGLDYSGWIVLNEQEIATFTGTFVPHVFDLTPHLKPSDNVLRIVFDCPPRWLGYCGATSKWRDWKPRFNYTWDWSPRLVQIGIWDSAFLEASDETCIDGFACACDVDLETGRGIVNARADSRGGSAAELLLEREGTLVHRERFSPSELQAGLTWRDLPVDMWWTNALGEQPLYTLRCRLLDADGGEIDSVARAVGFRHIAWESCQGAPDGADPWICTVNGQPVFLQGVNWTPIRPNFADVAEADYRRRLQTYRDLGINILRVWGGAFLEKECFYDICDGLGILVWQEFPISSSWMENWPPEDPQVIAGAAEIAESYIHRRRHHPSLAVWCGGNELQGGLDGSKCGRGRPAGLSHPLLERFNEIVSECDPGRRFCATSASGPREFGDEDEFGQGVHWDVHGPWCSDGDSLDGWTDYWRRDDALFRSEVGHPGASDAELIRRCSGDCGERPAPHGNDYWTHPCPAWVQWPRFVSEHGREPESLEEYVTWSQALQADALRIAASACKSRFPRCGGIIVWMGHDSFPCAANTSILDFHGEPKPAALALGEVFRGDVSDQSTAVT